MRTLERVLLAIILLPLGLSPSTSLATSRVERVHKNAQGILVADAPVAHCEIHGQYKKAFLKEGQVYWRIDVDSSKRVGLSSCPKKKLELLIWGGEYALGQFVYPEFIREPKENSNVVVRTHRREINDTHTQKHFHEWMVIDWQGGFEVVP